MIENTKEAYEVPVVDISCERWNKAGVAVIKVHECKENSTKITLYFWRYQRMWL